MKSSLLLTWSPEIPAGSTIVRTTRGELTYDAPWAIETRDVPTQRWAGGSGSGSGSGGGVPVGTTGAADAPVEPAWLVAITVHPRRAPTSPELTTWVEVSPTCTVPRSQTNEKRGAGVPLQAPVAQVRVRPRAAVPTMVGALVLAGLTAVPTNHGSLDAEAVPVVVVAVTRQTSSVPSSAGPSAYVDPLTPATRVPSRSHW